jgi:4-hydroxy-3-methylbut-2-enyl diphosphate reductase
MMGHSSDIPRLYRGAIISRVKESRQAQDPRKQDLTPSVLDFGPVRFVLSRHFGFCFGVENAVEIAYRTLEENPGRRIFFLSEMIHNPKVNRDLRDRGVAFIFSPPGEQLVPWEDLTPEDIVVVPAFGTTLEMEAKLAERGIDPYRYNTTCPFVEKVWKRSHQLGERDFTVIVHGKAAHEETRATFSHSARNAPTVVVRDLDEGKARARRVRRALRRKVLPGLRSGPRPPARRGRQPDDDARSGNARGHPDPPRRYGLEVRERVRGRPLRRHVRHALLRD